ncbi:hypothetical protein DLAC_06692 [Tieghemostelium lacteum]|uniref:Uncharacterized protein n=1 Tax=Tieghemostelium lacteum TaxID=361077 RepID=A0A151ZFE7_TIELA|nr:hypothetical protein DLAC_06692 [Tieghemostelium lacteum]|eukprot:KYQ92693.1 hypothetical protein DLAC_06692 [Tieghemostelium lacteum]
MYNYSQDEYYWKIQSQMTYENLPKLKNKSNESSWKTFYLSNRLSRYLVIGSEIDEMKIIDIKERLQNRGLLNVDHYNVYGFLSLPDDNFLHRYDAIFFFSYCGFKQISIGNQLSHFVDSGGGVVVCAYTTGCGRGNRLEGRWLEGGYSPFLDGVTQRISQLKIGTKHNQSHPILSNLNDQHFTGGQHSSHSDAIPSETALKICDWSNGKTLIAEIHKPNAKIIGLNFYPPEIVASNDKSNSDIILYNALKYVSNFNKNKEGETM